MAAPEIEFLRPSFRGEWVVHPAPPIRFWGLPACPAGTFERRIVMTNSPARLDVALYACRGFCLNVNDKAAVAVADEKEWKRPVSVNLAPYLRPGTNVLNIKVFGTNGPPALLVEGPPDFATGTNWTVKCGGGRARPAVVAGQGEDFMRADDGALWRHKHRRLFGWLFAIYAAFIAYALVPVRFKPWMRAKAAEDRPVCPLTISGKERAPTRIGRVLASVGRFVVRYGICLAILGAVAVVQYRNTSDYPYTRSGFDVQGHVDYVRLAAERRTVPMATDGWEMFQPPAYYFCAATIYNAWGGRKAEPRSLGAVQMFTTTCGILTLVFALGLLWLLFPDRPLARNLGFASVAFLPMHFYMNPMITNEVFAGAAISGALLVAVWALRSNRPPWIRVMAAALACGFAMLSKYSGLFCLLSVVAWLGVRVLADIRRVRAWGVLVSFLVGVLLVCGWFYQRNVSAYGDPFVGNWDNASGFRYEQPPGYRTAGFYGRFGGVFFNQPGWSIWTSFWDGQYASIWADPHGAFVKQGDKGPELFVAAIICLAILPVVAFLLGFGQTVRRLLQKQWDDPMLAVVLVIFLSFVGVMAFTLEVPTYSTIKGFFFLSLIPAAAVISGAGFETIARQLGRLRWGMYVCMGALGGLVVNVYRYAG